MPLTASVRGLHRGSLIKYYAEVMITRYGGYFIDGILFVLKLLRVC